MTFKLVFLLKSLNSLPILKDLMIVAVKPILLKEVKELSKKPAIEPITMTRSKMFQLSIVNLLP
jgi:hypothetical protein